MLDEAKIMAYRDEIVSSGLSYLNGLGYFYVDAKTIISDFVYASVFEEMLRNDFEEPNPERDEAISRLRVQLTKTLG